MNYTVFTTYLLVPTGNTTGSGYTQAIHCNYINSVEIETDNLYIQEISFNFPNINDFKFLNSGFTTTTGFQAHRIQILVQTGITSTDVKPDSANWRVYDVTEQITGYISGQLLSAAQLVSVVFKTPLNLYSGKSIYNLTYLNYPSSSQTEEMVFGDATYFFGNLSTTIKADVYTTDLSINLQLNEFNSSTNLTWNGIDTVYVSEVGLYDSNKNLVGIGKLNDPVAKDATISRTIVFALDF